MIQMENPKRKMQKRNDYQRHKLFRKIKRRRKAQAEADQHIAEKQLRKKLKLPKFDRGEDELSTYKKQVEMFNDANSDPTLPCRLVDRNRVTVNPETGDVMETGGHVILDPVIITGKMPDNLKRTIESNRIQDLLYKDRLSPVDPIGEFVVESAAIGKPLELAGKAALYGIGRFGKKFSDKIQNTKELLELSKENHNPFNNAFTRSILYSYLPPASYSARKLVAPALAWPYYILKGSAPDINKAFWTQNNFAGKALKSVFEKAYNVDGDIALQARANAYRRYLKLPQSGDYQFTQSAADRTKLTNIDALKQLKGKGYGGGARDIEVVNAGTPFADKDFITSAGGNVSVSTKLLNKKPIEGIIKVNDTWDLMPGQRINKKISNFFNEYRTKSINKFGTRLKSKSKDFIGYRNQGLFDRMDYPDWMTISQKIKLSDIIDKGGATRTATNNSGLIGMLGRSGIKLGDYLQNFNYKNTNLYNHLNNLEVGKYIGAEPFDIQYDLPFHIQDHKINIGLGRTPTPLENKIYPQLLQFHNSGKDINIKPSKRGTFTKAAKQHGMSVQGFANRVLRNPSKYSATMRKKANFARNASKWNK